MNKRRQRLEDKVAIVTGGAHGIGRAIAVGMAQEGAKVVIADINFEAAEVVAKYIRSKGGEALAFRADVSSPESTKEMAERTVEYFGKINILVNNAAIFGKVRISRVPFYELDLDEWDRVIAVNLKGTLLSCRAVYPHMKTQGGGKIINVSSNVVFSGNPNYVHYVASKAGVVGLARCMAREVGADNISVNCIAPGSTLADDPSNKAFYESRIRIMTEHVVPTRSFKRIEYPDDLVGVTIFLASSDSDFITGQTIVVDGGEMLH